MDREKQEEKRMERPRFRGEGQYTENGRNGGQRQQTGRRVYHPEQPVAGRSSQSQETVCRTYHSEQPAAGRSSQSQMSGSRVYHPDRSAGHGVSGSREARARAMARRRKKRRQQQRMLIAAAAALLLLIGGAISGVFYWKDWSARKESAEAGVAAAEAGNYEDAIAAFDSALKPGGAIGKFETDVLLNRAEAEYRQGSYDKALETYRLVAEDDKNNELAKKGVVLCLMEQGAYEEALAVEVLQSQVYNRMAVDQIEAGQYEAALNSITLGRGFPDTSAAQDLSFNEAVAYEKMGDYAKALTLFEAYTAQYGADERAQRELAFLRTRQGNNGQ